MVNFYLEGLCTGELLIRVMGVMLTSRSQGLDFLVL